MKSVSYREWKEQNKPKKPPVLAIATTAGTGGVRIFDHILYPKKVTKVKAPPPKAKIEQKPLYRDVGVQTEPQHRYYYVYKSIKTTAFYVMAS